MGGSGHRMLGSCHRLSQPIHLSTTPLTAAMACDHPQVFNSHITWHGRCATEWLMELHSCAGIPDHTPMLSQDPSLVNCYDPSLIN